MTITKDRRLPLKAAGTLAVFSFSVRIILGTLYQNMETGEFTGPNVLLYASGALFIAALAALAILALTTYGDSLARAEHIGGSEATFIFSMTGFFFLFSSAFIVYSMLKGIEFHSGSTVVSEIILLLFSLGTAFFCFVEASSLGEKLIKNPLYPLMYLFPIGWTAVRLFVMFTTFTARATYLTEKLQILSITALCIYYLYEARLMRAVEPVSVKAYSVITSLTLAIVPLSAIPTLIFSLIYQTNSKIGEPLFCLVELSLCCVAVMRAKNVLANASVKEELPDENS